MLEAVGPWCLCHCPPRPSTCPAASGALGGEMQRGVREGCLLLSTAAVGPWSGSSGHERVVETPTWDPHTGDSHWPPETGLLLPLAVRGCSPRPLCVAGQAVLGEGKGWSLRRHRPLPAFPVPTWPMGNSSRPYSVGFLKHRLLPRTDSGDSRLVKLGTVGRAQSSLREDSSLQRDLRSLQAF